MSDTRIPAGRADQYWAVVLLAIVLVAGALRAGMVHYANRQAAASRAQGQPDPYLWPDSERYLQAAANVAAGQGPMVSPSDRTGVDPGYPMLLSWPLRMWHGDIGKAAAAARWMNVAAGLATVVFVAYLGRVLFGSLAGLVAAGILAVQPIQAYFHALVLTEVIYTTLLAGSLYALARYMLGGGGAYLFGCAIGLGLGTLIRSSGLFLPFFLLPLVGYAGWQRGRFSGAAAAKVAFVVLYACVLVPAAYRNYRILGAFVPVRTGVGTSLLESVGPWADGGPGMEKFVPGRQYPAGANEYERDQVDRREAIGYIKQDPGRFLHLAWVKLLRTWNVRMNLSGYRLPLYDVLAMVSTIPVFVLAAIGLLRHWRQAGRWALLLVPVVYFTLLHMVFVGSVRYRYPVEPGIMVLAGAALAGSAKPRQEAGARVGQEAAK